MRYLPLILLLLPLAALGQDHEPRQWVEVKYPTHDDPIRLNNADRGSYYVGSNGGAEVSLLVTAVAQSLFDYDLIFEGTTTFYYIDGVEDHYTGELVRNPAWANPNNYEIVQWGPAFDEQEQIQPRQWVQIKIPNSDDGSHYYEGSLGERKIPPGSIVLKYDPDQGVITYNLQDTPFPGDMILEVREASDLWSFSLTIQTGNGDNWSRSSEPNALYTDVLTGGPLVSEDAEILAWGDPWVDEDGDGEPDDPDEPPADDPDSDGDGEPDSTDEDDDNDGTPDDEEPLFEAPETGLDCIDEKIDEINNALQFDAFIDAFESGNEEAVIPLTMPRPFADGTFTVDINLRDPMFSPGLEAMRTAWLLLLKIIVTWGMLNAVVNALAYF